MERGAATEMFPVATTVIATPVVSILYRFSQASALRKKLKSQRFLHLVHTRRAK